MIITIAADVLGEENNGTTVAAMNLIRYLQSVGDTVRILCADQEKKGLPGYYVVPNRSFGLLADKVLEKNGVKLAKRDEKVVREALLGSDICHIMLPFELGKAALRIAREMDIPVTAGFHCQAENFTSHFGLINVRSANWLFYQIIYRRFYRFADRIHYPTQFIRDVFEQAVRHKTPGRVVSNGVNSCFIPTEVQRPAVLRDRFVILFIGRLSREKSHRVLVEAAARSRYRDRIRLIFAGSGPKKEQILRLARRLDIEPPIIHFFTHEELTGVINMADLYCHPAEIEIEAIGCLEAISCGLVPVISDSGRSATRAFALDERNLFRCNDPSDLAEKIDYWISHPEEKEACRKRYEHESVRFELEHCMKMTREILREAYEEKKGHILP